MKWEYEFYYASTVRGILATAKNLSNIKNKDSEGKYPHQAINDYGKLGWELVSVTPVSPLPKNPITSEILFTFKRPLQE